MTKVREGVPSTTDESLLPADATWRFEPTLTGLALAIVSAIFYTGANMALRQLAGKPGVDWAIWVTANKALPAAALAWGIIGYRAWKGQPALPTRDVLKTLLFAGVVMQLVGNLMFQIALSFGGLALSVPLCFATLITTGAVLGRVFLGESITLRTAAAMGMLIASIGLLSQGAGTSTQAVREVGSAWTVTLAVLTACLSGVGYGTCGVIIRSTLKRKLPLSATLMPMSTMGAVGLGAVSLFRLGSEGILATTSTEVFVMLGAGLCNAVAFFAVGAALRHITVVQANMLNATQSAMCAVVGFLFFDEPWTWWLGIGIILTGVGVGLVDKTAPVSKSDS